MNINKKINYFSNSAKLEHIAKPKQVWFSGKTFLAINSTKAENSAAWVT